MIKKPNIYIGSSAKNQKITVKMQKSSRSYLNMAKSSASLTLIITLTLLAIGEVKCDEESVGNAEDYPTTSTSGLLQRDEPLSSTNSNNRPRDNPKQLGNNNCNADDDDECVWDVSISSVETSVNYGNPSYITEGDRLHDCGQHDQCEKVGIKNPLTANQMCSCDLGKCENYGDCCWPLVVNKTLPKSRSLWHCNRLEVTNTTTIEATYALMVSECPESSQDEISKQLCSGENIPSENYTYLIDTPVYGNKSGKGILYKNIYCARCHEERSSNIMQWTLALACDTEFTPQQRSEFMSTAKYIPGYRLWKSVDETSQCALKIVEFAYKPVDETIPDIRFCPSVPIIDSCSASFVASTDVASLRRIAKLCSTYTQYVKHPTNGKVFKNPHCAVCQNAIEETVPLTCRKPVYNFIGMRIKPGHAGAMLPGAGLNFLFDFGFGGNKYVGYDMLCKDNEIWDYIRQKCGPMICGNGYRLINGVCVRNPPVGSGGSGGNTGGGGGGNDNDSSVESDEDDYANRTLPSDEHPACSKYRILFHQYEYSFLDNPNTSIVIRIPNRINNDELQSIILTESEYEFVNETTISICAKNLHHAFKPTFPASLTYLSLVSVGLSAVFLFVHLLLYAILPKLRNPPGRNLFCLTSSLFIFQFLFLTMISHTRFDWLCTAAAIMMHYFFLSAFFWMNIMSFDMWRTFSCNSLLRRSHSTESQKFLKYSTFAWITPALIVTIAAIIDFGFPSDYYYDRQRKDVLGSIRPWYGDNGLCWITQRTALFIFVATPVLFILISNLVLFSCTARAILSQQKESNRVFKGKKVPGKGNNSIITNDSSTATTSQGSSPSKATNRDKLRFMLYVNMALIMGLGWVLGFISQFLAMDWLQYFFVIVNGLQGTFIFFAFDFKWKVYRMLQDRLCEGKLAKVLGLERNSTTATDHRRGTVSFSSGTKSTNMNSSDDEKRRKSSAAV